MTAADPTGDRRTVELRSALAGVRDRVARACAGVGRQPDELTVVVVTKTFPAGDVRRLHALGVADVGEAREQELRAKAGELAGPVAGPVAGRLRWHFVGRLQRNKARSVGRLATVVHSVDDERLVPLLARGAADAGRPVGCFVQASLDGDPRRGGVPAEAVPGLADRVVAEDGLELLGVMAVAPLGRDPAGEFARLAAISRSLASRHPAATAVSAGMSADLEAAVRSGATHLRVGSAVLGSRPSLG